MLAYTLGRRPGAGEDTAGEDGDAEEHLTDWMILSPTEREAFPPDHPVWAEVKEWAATREDGKWAISARIEAEHGVVPRWARMSKSKGNIVTPDEMCQRFGADTPAHLRDVRRPVRGQCAVDRGRHVRRAPVPQSRVALDGIGRRCRTTSPELARLTVGAARDEASAQGAAQAAPDHREGIGGYRGFRFNTAIAALMETGQRAATCTDRPDGGARRTRRRLGGAGGAGAAAGALRAAHGGRDVGALGDAGTTYEAGWPGASTRRWPRRTR